MFRIASFNSQYGKGKAVVTPTMSTCPVEEDASEIAGVIAIKTDVELNEQELIDEKDADVEFNEQELIDEKDADVKLNEQELIDEKDTEICQRTDTTDGNSYLVNQLDDLLTFLDNRLSEGGIVHTIWDFSRNRFHNKIIDPAMGAFKSLNISEMFENLSGLYIYKYIFKNMKDAMQMISNSEPKHAPYYDDLKEQEKSFLLFLNKFDVLLEVLRSYHVKAPETPADLKFFSVINLNLATEEFLKSTDGIKLMEEQKESEKDLLVPLRNYVVLRCFLKARNEFKNYSEYLIRHLPNQDNQ